LNDAIKAKHSHLAKKKMLFHHPQYTRLHSIVEKLHGLRFELILHALYLSNLVLSYFFLLCKYEEMAR